jgi:hypothetical protein
MRVGTTTPAITAYHVSALATRRPRSASRAASQVTAITTAARKRLLFCRPGSMTKAACSVIVPMIPGQARTKLAHSSQMTRKPQLSPNASRVHT